MAEAVAAAGAAAGLEVAATAGSLDAEGASDAEVASGSEVAAAAGASVAAAAGSAASGLAVGGLAAYRGERAACVESRDLTAGLTEGAVIGLEAPQAQAPRRRLRS